MAKGRPKLLPTKSSWSRRRHLRRHGGHCHLESETSATRGGGPYVLPATTGKICTLKTTRQDPTRREVPGPVVVDRREGGGGGAVAVAAAARPIETIRNGDGDGEEAMQEGGSLFHFSVTTEETEMVREKIRSANMNCNQSYASSSSSQRSVHDVDDDDGIGRNGRRRKGKAGVKDDPYRPKKSARIQKHWDHAIRSDGDVWIERFFRDRKSGKHIYFYCSLATDQYRLHEPPTGSAIVIRQDEMSRQPDAIKRIGNKVISRRSFEKLQRTTPDQRLQDDMEKQRHAPVPPSVRNPYAALASEGHNRSAAVADNTLIDSVPDLQGRMEQVVPPAAVAPRARQSKDHRKRSQWMEV